MTAQSTTADGAKPSRRRSGGRGITTVIVGILAVALLVWVAPPAEVIHQLGDMNPVWVLVAIGLELLSCLSYVVVFRLIFPEPPRARARRVAWIAMGAGAVLPGGNISSAAATGLLLRRSGVGTRLLIERCAALLCLLTAFGFFVNGVAGLLLLAGVPGGPHDLRHTGGPILVSVVVLSTAALVMVATRRLGRRAPKPLRGIGAGLEGAWRQAGSGHWRLLGGAGFFCFDLAALWAACAATGHPLGLPAVAIAYCIGYLATAVPMPAGLGVLDSGLAAALVLYGMPPAAAVGAVLVYHAIAIWVPGLGGVVAWLPTRRRTAEVTARPLAAAFAVPRLTPVADES
jgi:uncharacterized membrane protein YbhN (UPF0104 family)